MIYDIITEAKEKYPKAYKRATQFSMNYLKVFEKEFIKEGEDDESESEVLPDSMADAVTYSTFAVNHRALYDFFDENEVYVLINKGKDGWLYNIVSEGGGAGSSYSPSRIIAEDLAFKTAFQVLENKL